MNAKIAEMLGFLPKVIGCIVLAGACARPAAAELVVIDSGFTNSTATTLSYVTNRYDGHGHVISDNLTLDHTTYLRLKGGTSSNHDRLDVGPADANAANKCPTITIDDYAGFYCTYRSSKGVPDSDETGGGVRSYLDTYIGANGGSAKFVVKSSASKFGGNIQGRGLWLEDVFVRENATSEGDYIDVLQLEAGGVADIDMLYTYNTKPVRILFNGGSFEDHYNQHNDGNGPFRPAVNCKMVLEGLNGKDVSIRKSYYGHSLNGGMGTLRFQGDCNVVLNDGGTVLPGLPNANRTELTLDPNKGPIEWGQKGDLIFGGQAHIKCAGDNRLPYTVEEGIVRMREGKYGSVLYGAILDLNNTSQRVRSLIAESTLPMVTNVAHASYTKSKLVFGYGDTDGIFSAKTYYGVSAEKVGTGTLVISNVTMDVNNTGNGEFVAKEGTVILVGTNKIGADDFLSSSRFAVSNGVTVIREVVVDVASGETIQTAVYDDEGDVKVRVRKTGAGTLVLDRENTFSGGLVIDQGIVKVTAADAQGTGKIIVNSTNTKVCQIKFATPPVPANGSVTYTNDIVVTGKSSAYNGSSVSFNYAAIRMAQTNQVLSGSITAADDLFIADDDSCIAGGAGKLQEISTLTCNGDVTVASGHTLYVTAGSKQYWYGKITADTLQIPAIGSYRGAFNLYNANNAIGTLKLDASADNCKTWVQTAGALDGAKVEHTGYNPNGQSNIRGTLDPVKSTTIRSLSGVDYDRTTMGASAKRAIDTADNCGYSVGYNSGYTLTLTVTGMGEVATAKYCGGIGDNNLSFVLNAPNYTQIFSNVLYSCKAELKVKKGTLIIDGKSYFPNLETITVEGDGVLDIRGLGAANPATTDFLPKLTTVNVASTAKLKLAEGIAITSAVVKVDGFQLDANTPTAGRPWLEGKGTLTPTTSPTLPVTATDATWNGGAGEDTSVGTATNWKDSPAPAFYYIGYRPVFGEGGSAAVFPAGLSYLNGILFKGEDFTVSAAAEANLKVMGDISVDGTDENAVRTYTISAPFNIQDSANTTWTVPTNKTLKLAGGLVRSGEMTNKVVKSGKGTLELAGCRLDGPVETRDGVLKLNGNITAETDDDSWLSHDYRNYKGTLALDNATLDKRFLINVGELYSGGTDLFLGSSGTNVFKRQVAQACATTIVLPTETCLVFEKGFGDYRDFGGASDQKGNLLIKTASGAVNSAIIFKGPLVLAGQLFGSYPRIGEINVIFETTNNCCNGGINFNYMTTHFKVDNAFTNTYVTVGGGGSESTVNFGTTRQEFKRVRATQTKGFFKGEYPATLVVTYGETDRDTAIKGGQFAIGTINGWLKLEKSGVGYQTLGYTNQTENILVNYASYGDIEVSGGTMEILPAATWLNGTNFICRGNGTFKLTSASKAQIGPQAKFQFADTGKVEIPTGVTYTVQSITVDGTEVTGSFNTSTTEGPMAGRVTGGGTLRTKTGMIIFVH